MTKRFEPTPCREWTWWDHLVYRVTGRVSRRVYEDRLVCMWADDAKIRLEALNRELDRLGGAS